MAKHKTFLDACKGISRGKVGNLSTQVARLILNNPRSAELQPDMEYADIEHLCREIGLPEDCMRSVSYIWSTSEQMVNMKKSYKRDVLGTSGMGVKRADWDDEQAETNTSSKLF